MKIFFTTLTICFVLVGCSGMKHIGYTCIGKTKDDFIKQFGPPMRVEPSIEGVETWVYKMGGGVKTYTFQEDSCIKQGSRSQG